MDPKDRVETLIKTKASSIHKRISGNESPAGAGYQVAPADVKTILSECGQRGQRRVVSGVNTRREGGVSPAIRRPLKSV